MRRNEMHKKSYILAFVLISLAVVAAISGMMFAKYIKQLSYNGSVTVYADLAEEFTLYEHVAEKQPDGSYKLTEDTTNANSYTVLPGLDVPKDPTIYITGKTDIDAYLYIEVVDNIDSAETKIEYKLTSDWLLLSGTDSPNGGKIYVYASDKTPLVLDKEFEDQEIIILDPKQFTVSESLPRETNVKIEFYAYMAQIGDGTADDTNSNAVGVFNANF